MEVFNDRAFLPHVFQISQIIILCKLYLIENATVKDLRLL